MKLEAKKPTEYPAKKPTSRARHTVRHSVREKFICKLSVEHFVKLRA